MMRSGRLVLVRHALVPVLAIALSLAGFALPAVSNAQVAAPSDEARRHFERGVLLMGQSRWQDAIRELDAARAIRTTAPLLFNLGLAQRAVGRGRDAIASFQQFLSLAGTQIDETRRREVDGYITDLTASLAHLLVRVAPTDAIITVDDARVPGDRTDIPLDPGTHRVHARASGFDGESRNVTLEPGSRVEIEIHLNRTDNTAHLHVESNVPTAVVLIDGHDVGNGSIDERLPAGRHEVLVRASGYSVFRRELHLDVGDRSRIQAVLVRPGGGLAAGVWVAVGVGAVVLSVAVVVSVFVFAPTEEPYAGRLGLVSAAIEAAR